MIKKLLPLLLLINIITISPAKANSCNLPYLPSSVNQTKKTGTINVQILFVKFADSGKKSKGYIKNHLSNIDLKEINNYIKETSQNKAKLKFTINNSWITLPNKSYQYGVQGMMTEQEENNFGNAILSAADPKVDFSKVDSVWVIPDPESAPYMLAFRNAFVADGKQMLMALYSETNSYLAVSEILHTLGLRDLYSGMGLGPDGGMTQFSIMAQYYGGTNLLGFEKYSLGWMSPEDVICQENGSQTIKINSLDSKGLKLVLLPINAQEMLAIEYRKKEKRDRYLGGSGILVYHINNNFGYTSPINPLFFGNKGNVNFAGINININKTNITINR